MSRGIPRCSIVVSAALALAGCSHKTPHPLPETVLALPAERGEDSRRVEHVELRAKVYAVGYASTEVDTISCTVTRKGTSGTAKLPVVLELPVVIGPVAPVTLHCTGLIGGDRIEENTTLRITPEAVLDATSPERLYPEFAVVGVRAPS